MTLLVNTVKGLKLTDSASQTIVSIEKQIAELEREERALKEKIIAQMKNHDCKKIENDSLRITYIEPTTRRTLDSAKIKATLPDVYDMFSKESFVSESIKIQCK